MVAIKVLCITEALVPGYQEFKGLDVDSDVAWYLFTYRLPDYPIDAVLSMLRQQISQKSECFNTVLETSTELQMRCRIVTFGEVGFNEYRILFDRRTKRVTVMFGNFDSPTEQSSYSAFVQALRDAHTKQ